MISLNVWKYMFIWFYEHIRNISSFRLKYLNSFKNIKPITAIRFLSIYISIIFYIIAHFKSIYVLYITWKTYKDFMDEIPSST